MKRHSWTLIEINFIGAFKREAQTINSKSQLHKLLQLHLHKRKWWVHLVDMHIQKQSHFHKVQHIVGRTSLEPILDEIKQLWNSSTCSKWEIIRTLIRSYIRSSRTRVSTGFRTSTPVFQGLHKSKFSYCNSNRYNRCTILLYCMVECNFHFQVRRTWFLRERSQRKSTNRILERLCNWNKIPQKNILHLVFVNTETKE